ncbi:MAG: DUF1566 domain-containing protein, partial [Alistipes sp.]|nr:DUF1566 domain-containing protein [Alistipes sp.]
VMLTTDPSAEIWINNQKQGTGSWSGQLTSGTYIFEARKEGHRTTRLSQVITSAQATQSYKLATPTPIEGSLNITSVPALASVKVDGKVMGDAPLATKLLVGRHTIEVSKSGYGTWRKEVTIAEGQTATVAATLTKASVPAVRTTTTKGQPTQGPYKVGDYYNENGKEGVVFWVDASGEHGKIVSLTESKTRLQWASVESEQRRLIGADDKENGANNMAKVRQIYDWQSKYPAFKWCADLGEGWYLPAIKELKLFTLDETVRNAINQTLATKGGTKIPDIDTLHWYWSSTESNVKYGEEFCAWGVYMRNGSPSLNDKRSNRYVRAVSAFGNKSQPATTQSTTTAAPAVVSGSTYGLYKVGDYYNENGKEGVVFWVDASGEHGKIVSLTESKTKLQWTSDKIEQRRLIGADDEENGANNMAKVRQIPDWKSKYPAFKWCADLGEGWYLPAIVELKLFTLDNTVRNAVNQTLATKGGTKITDIGTTHWYWSSTESNHKYEGMFCAWGVLKSLDFTGSVNKGNYSYVRAVSAF